jgi:molecular chaperone DnaK (HSP70)
LAKAIGIDLGTTSSALALAISNGAVQLARFSGELGSTLVVGRPVHLALHAVELLG